MDEKTAFCENCRKDLLYTTKKRSAKFVHNNGQQYVYEEVTAKCIYFRNNGYKFRKSQQSYWAKLNSV